jgi:hypothetical protein
MPDFARAGDRDHRFSAGYPSVEKEGAVSGMGNIRPVSPEMNCDLDKSDPVAGDGNKESQRAIRIGGGPGPLHGDRCRRPWDPLRPAPAFPST